MAYEVTLHQAGGRLGAGPELNLKPRYAESGKVASPRGEGHRIPFRIEKPTRASSAPVSHSPPAPHVRGVPSATTATGLRQVSAR